MTALLVAAGGALGAVLRWQLSTRARERGATSAGGTLLVNVIACFALGLVSGWDGRPDWLLALVGVGVCGGLSTFSTHALELAQAWRDDERRLGTVNLGLSAALGVAALSLGWSLTA